MAETKTRAGEAVTQDGFFGGQVQVFQPRDGFRAGTDSVLLAAALPLDLTGSVLELGCGAGGALLPAAHRLSRATFVGLEQDSAMLDLARRGIVENRFETRIELVNGDAGALPADWQNRFDLVFSNPPFFEPTKIQAPGLGKTAAYLESLSLKAWLNAMLFATRPKGRVIMIHRAAELARILSVLERQAGEICVQPVHSFPGAEAKRVLVRARKGLRPGAMRLLEPVYLYTEKGGARSDWAYRLQTEGAGLEWD